ncbi:MAG: fatty acyl-AMP ligase [Sulfurifustis sp.]
MEKDFRDVLLERLNTAHDRLAYSFISDTGAVREVSYLQLLQRAVDIGAALGAYARAGDRIVMLLPPGIDYVASFLGCWIHGFIAVPAYPPRKNQRAARTENIIASAEPSVVIFDAPDAGGAAHLPSLCRDAEPMFLSSVRDGAVRVDDLDRYIADTMTDRRADDLVFLQYTSGSTGTPKGTMVSHDNLVHNSHEMSRKFRTSRDSTMVSWLPPYHDMGLILGILQPLYVGFPSHLMSPAVFMQRPLQWLRRIAQTRATLSGGPNFAFDLCVRRAAELQNDRIDLSSWEVAFNGAEPINPATLRRFATTFKRYGFNARALHPCYGLAENTLMATGQDRVPENDRSPRCFIAAADREDIADEPAAEIVSCGSSIPGQDLVIVNPATGEPCPEGTIGEVWITGRSVAKGYWQNPADTAATFRATLAGRAHGPRYLRTGDLAETRNGEVYIRGRLKDIIIVRGVKYYPQDIERVIEEAHPQIRHGGYCAVFQSDEIQPESIAVVAEIAREHRRLDSDKLADTIRAVVTSEFRLRVSSVSILPPGRFPKTSSGKIPRNVIKTALLERELSTA